MNAVVSNTRDVARITKTRRGDGIEGGSIIEHARIAMDLSRLQAQLTGFLPVQRTVEPVIQGTKQAAAMAQQLPRGARQGPQKREELKKPLEGQGLAAVQEGQLPQAPGKRSGPAGSPSRPGIG